MDIKQQKSIGVKAKRRFWVGFIISFVIAVLYLMSEMPLVVASEGYFSDPTIGKLTNYFLVFAATIPFSCGWGLVASMNKKSDLRVALLFVLVGLAVTVGWNFHYEPFTPFHSFGVMTFFIVLAGLYKFQFMKEE